jgi:hypothetical protein
MTHKKVGEFGAAAHQLFHGEDVQTGDHRPLQNYGHRRAQHRKH